MQKISSGIESLDRLIDSFYIGDNVVWEVDAGAPYNLFVQNFIGQAFSDFQKVIYISFNRSPQSILRSVQDIMSHDHFILIDCFTSGKGKNDKTFKRFYDKPPDLNIVMIDDPKDIEQFTHTLNSIEDSLPPGARYVFDSLTGMQDLWGDEDDTYRFFTYMCPRLFDLDTVAYWILDREAHGQKFKANLRHITQVVLELYEKRDMLYLKALKLDRRQDREAFKPHLYETKDRNISINIPRKESSIEIGHKLREIRTRAAISQKELADKVNLSPSLISQVENNQISPSLSTFVQLCNALGVSVAALLDEKPSRKTDWLIRRRNGTTPPLLQEKGLRVFNILAGSAVPGSASFHLAVIEAQTEIDRHFMMHKGKEFIHVLKGGVDIVVNDVRKSLTAGDSVYLKEEIPASWNNRTDDDAELLVIYM